MVIKSLCRGGSFLILVILATGALAEPASQKPKVLINQSEFRDRVYACWMGKNIGGTLGMPFEGKKEPQDVSFYTKLKPGEPAANDDLDLQLLWLKAMEDYGGRVDARILGEHWLRFVPVDWNEYGVGKRNMRMGLLPPLSGEYNNGQWKHSNGAWIRSEIWACLAPGVPALAARMAREDACVDHGAAEGTLAEIFTAAIESAAFVEFDRDKLLQVGLSMIPQDSQLAIGIRAAISARKDGKDWRAARLDVIQATEKTGWFQAPRNVAYTVLGWLYGEGDFGKSICTAVNCGDDTDCTGATLGSIFGILYRTGGIPAKWAEPIGTKIKTVAIKGFDHPQDINELTDRTVAMTRRILDMNRAPVGLTDGPTDLRLVRELTLADTAAARLLWNLSPYQIIWNETDLQIILDYVQDPTISENASHPLRITVRNLAKETRSFSIRLKEVPDGWQATGLPAAPAKLGPGKKQKWEVSLGAGRVTPSPTRMMLEVSGAAKPVSVPVTLIGK